MDFSLLLPYSSIVSKNAQAFNVPQKLIYSIMYQESKGNPWSMRYEPTYKWLYNEADISKVLGVDLETEIIAQKQSYGLMQIMGAKARELGDRDKYLSHLYDPEVNVGYAARMLAQLQARYKNPSDLIAAYNAGHPTIINGQYSNQKYVSNVLMNLKDLKDIG